MIVAIFFLLVGLGILILGADLLVRGASSISRKLGIPPLVIGLTVVAFGTSAPELIVNILSSMKGATDIAVGNIIGSNISNILLILGVASIIVDLRVQKSTEWKEIPLALLAVIMIFVMGNDVLFDKVGHDLISRTDGLALIGFFCIFLYYTFNLAMAKDENEKQEDDSIKVYALSLSFIFTILGLFGLFFGGKMLVDNAIVLARIAGISELLIGLTVVAVGTSLPELATSCIAAFKNQDDIAVGNVVGSNIFNIFWILGVSSIIKELPVSSVAQVDMIFCMIVTLALFLAMFVGKKRKLERWQGILFIVSYIGYTIYLIHRG